MVLSVSYTHLAIFTIQITALSVAIGIIIGLFVGVARISKIRIIKWLAAI